MDSQETLTQVGVNTHVTVELIAAGGGAETMELDLVRAQAADIDAGFVSETSPLARAILGKRVGATVPYAMGDIMAVRILRVTPLRTAPPDDAAARRQAKLDEAVRKAEQTNAEMFASSYGSKWGGYEMPDDTDAAAEESSRS
ncbi:MAG: GreA/GreB family elongation factor [Caldilineaceae bacterium]|nr:GreA/GreB family elongation factor [Caldilineaceae bacterium]